ncbi:MAG: hypothetical protein AB7P31_05855 [Steroidobacteraceae bacterium]
MTEAPTRAKGPLPQYFDDPAIDQLHAALLALAAELSVAYDRIDTLERLLERKGAVARRDIEAFEPDEAALHERAARREALVARLLRPFRDYRDHLVERAQQ